MPLPFHKSWMHGLKRIEYERRWVRTLSVPIRVGLWQTLSAPYAEINGNPVPLIKFRNSPGLYFWHPQGSRKRTQTAMPECRQNFILTQNLCWGLPPLPRTSYTRDCPSAPLGTAGLANMRPSVIWILSVMWFNKHNKTGLQNITLQLY
jgi:hypothetical protein